MAGGPTVKRSTLLVAGLSTALVVSNAWWLYVVFDAGVTATYRDASLQSHHEALSQALAVLPIAASPKSTRADVLGAATNAARFKDSFDKDGYVWVGQLGFAFDTNGRVTKVAPAWDPF
jgi:hypothetical protein